MGTVVPFVPRQIGGDWSSTERERLAELAERLTARGARVDAAYGVSDRGDPWCVITDDRDEVMVHVARIDGRFIVHDAASDAIQDEDTLWRAFERLLGRAWREGRSAAVVTPLRDAQSLLALMAAIVFVHEIDRALPTLHASPGPHTSALGDLLALLHPPAAAGAERTTSLEAAKPAHAHYAQGAPGHGATAGHPESSLVLGQTDGHHPVQAPAADRTPGHGGEGVIRVSDDHGAVLVGGPGDDLLIGGRGGDHLMGGAGADTLDGGGARPGELDVLEGGAGDDQIRLAARTVAIGGEGHNVFVVTASNAAAGKAEPARGPVDAGVVLDFTAQDRFEFTGSLHPTVVSVEAEQDVLSGLHGFAALARTTATPGFRVGFDLNGDGRADVYVTVSGPAASSLTQGWRPEGSPLQSTPEHSLGLGGGHHTPAAGAFVLGS